MFGTKSGPQATPAAEAVDPYRVVTTSAADHEVERLLNTYTEAGWTVVAIQPIIMGSVTNVQVVFKR